jgi:DTW domain-containing protein YfiP
MHHISNLKIFANRMNWWKEATSIEKGNRCQKCWLRNYNCFCQQLESLATPIRSSLSQMFDENPVEIVIYYHPVELGRSANTAHLFQFAAPSVVCKTLMFADADNEEIFFQKIMEESLNGKSQTCILYPSHNSISMNTWLTSDSQSSSKELSSATSLLTANLVHPLLRFIILDGTYPQASRMIKFLSLKLNTSQSNQLPQFPFVHLDLDEAGVKSAVAGIMYQPAKEKICSFQAIILALYQIYQVQNLTDLMTHLLEAYLSHLIVHKIKYGKTIIRNSIPDVDNSPASYVQDLIVSIKFIFYIIFFLSHDIF